MEDLPPDDTVTQAKEGSQEHQVQLGKFFLKRSQVEDPEKAHVSATEGVDWLIKASRQGNEEATDELRQCLDKKIGITERNLADVSWCVQTPKLEKLARQAAKELFRKLNPLQGGVISKEDFVKGIDGISTSKEEKKLLEKAAKFKGTDKLTEDAFVNKLISRLHGYGGISLESVLQSDVEMEAYKNSSIVQKIFRYPGKFMTLLMDKMVDSAGSQGMVWLRSLIPTNQIYMIFAFFMYSLISLQLVLWFVPIFVFYISISAMVICTMQMFYSKRKIRDVKAMASMLHRFNEALDSESAESVYEWNKLTPYLSYFIALCFMCSSFAMSDKSWIPCSEFVVVGLFFTLTCFMALSDKYDYLALLSIALDFISTLPYFIEDFPHIPIISHILNLFCGSLFSIEIFPGMNINIGLPSLAYMVVPLLFIKMAIQKSWSGTYRVLIPHLVCFFWWKVSVMYFRYCSWIGLVRASVGWIFFVALLPIFILLLCFWLLLYCINMFTVANFLKVITTIILLAIPVVFGIWAKTGFQVRSFSLHGKSATARAILIGFCVVSVIPMLYYFTPPERDVEGQYMTWEQYRRYCSQPQWDQTNIADAMITCSNFKFNMVEWTGSVKKIVVKESFNQANAFLHYLPFVLSNWIRCTYGEAYPDCNTLEDETLKEKCQLSTMQSKGNCHLENMNRYTFEMWVRMPIDENNMHDVKLIASDWFKQTLLHIKQNDMVTFRASLQDGLGNIWPELRLYYIECQGCNNGEGLAYGSRSFLSETAWNVLNIVKRGGFETWNFFFAPVLELKVPKDVDPRTPEID